MTKLLSNKNRPVHVGAYPLEKLARAAVLHHLDDLPPMLGLSFRRPDDPTSTINAMQEYQAMLDATHEGLEKPEMAMIPDNPQERANH